MNTKEKWREMFVDMIQHIFFMSGNPYFKSLPRSERTYRKYYDEFMKRRNELNVQTTDEALECIFNGLQSIAHLL